MLKDGRERRAFLRVAIAAGIVTPGGIGGIISRALAQGAVEASGVHKFRGQVEINGQPANAGMAVKPGDTVTTGAKSYVTFVVGQDAFLLRGDSKLELGGSGVLVNLARIVTGKLLPVYGKGTPRTLHGTTAPSAFAVPVHR